MPAEDGQLDTARDLPDSCSAVIGRRHNEAPVGAEGSRADGRAVTLAGPVGAKDRELRSRARVPEARRSVASPGEHEGPSRIEGGHTQRGGVALQQELLEACRDVPYSRRQIA